MQQLTYIKKRTLEWWEVPAPSLQEPTDALVRPFAVARCDLDRAFLLQDVARLLKLGRLFGQVSRRTREDFGSPAFEGPFPYGHECVAEVVEVGPATTKLEVGDQVIVPFQISCGRCLSCLNGVTSHCETERSQRAVAAFGFSDHIGGAWGGAR